MQLIMEIKYLKSNNIKSYILDSELLLSKVLNKTERKIIN